MTQRCSTVVRSPYAAMGDAVLSQKQSLAQFTLASQIPWFTDWIVAGTSDPPPLLPTALRAAAGALVGYALSSGKNPIAYTVSGALLAATLGPLGLALPAGVRLMRK